MAVLPAALGSLLLRGTVQIRFGTKTLRLPGGTPIFAVSRQQFMKHPGSQIIEEKRFADNPILCEESHDISRSLSSHVRESSKSEPVLQFDDETFSTVEVGLRSAMGQCPVGKFAVFEFDHCAEGNLKGLLFLNDLIYI